MSNNQKTVNTAKDEYNTIVKEQARQTIDYIYDGLIGTEERNKLPESIFVKEFLPILTGEKEIDKKTNFFNNWVGVAGNASNELDVVDIKGEVIFTMPGLINTNLLKFQKRERHDSVLADMAEYNAAKSFLPMVAQNELMEKLENRVDRLSSGAIGVTESRWNNIFARYGKISGDTSVKSTGDVQDTDDVSYE